VRDKPRPWTRTRRRNTCAHTANATSLSPNAPIYSSTSALTAAKSHPYAVSRAVASDLASWATSRPTSGDIAVKSPSVVRYPAAISASASAATCEATSPYMASTALHLAVVHLLTVSRTQVLEQGPRFQCHLDRCATNSDFQLRHR
jgi:hypothetical protein